MENCIYFCLNFLNGHSCCYGNNEGSQVPGRVARGSSKRICRSELLEGLLKFVQDCHHLVGLDGKDDDVRVHDNCLIAGGHIDTKRL